MKLLWFRGVNRWLAMNLDDPMPRDHPDPATRAPGWKWEPTYATCLLFDSHTTPACYDFSPGYVIGQNVMLEPQYVPAHIQESITVALTMYRRITKR